MATTELGATTDMSTPEVGSTPVEWGGEAPDEGDDALLQVRVSVALSRWVPPLLLVLGAVGNTLSAAVLLRKSLRHTATAVFLVNLAAMDTLLLYRSLLRGWLIYAFRVDLLPARDAPCQLLMAAAYYARYMAAWSLVLVSAERLFAVYAPMKHSVWFSRKRALVYVTALHVIFVCVTSFFYRIYGAEGGRCARRPEYGRFWREVWQRAHLLLASVLPFLLMSATTLAIIVKLRQSRGKVAGTVPSLHTMLVTVNLVFLLCTLPGGASYALNDWLVRRAETPADTGNILLLRTVTNLLTYLNSTVNFILYVLFGRKFRLELIAMLRCAGARVHPATTTTTTAGNATTGV